ncbi:MAG: extracellular solute-binding protein [Treponema sp.]|nr:extracellular solute-binding protein [Treponema sp.]
MLKKTNLFCITLAAVFFLLPAAVWAGGGKDAIKGKKFVIGSWWDDYDVNTAKPTDEEGELQLERRKKILKEHDFTVQAKVISSFDNMMETVTTSIMAGKPAAHAFWLVPPWAVTLYRQGLISPLNEGKSVDLKASAFIPYEQVAYNQDVASIFTFDGKQYALGIGYGDSQHTSGVFYNKRLFKEAGLDPELPYNMQKAGTWTWDNFLDLCKKLTRDRNNNGVIDTYAMPAGLSGEILEVLVFSNGADFVKKDSSGKFVNASGSPEFLEALHFARRLYNEGIMMPAPEGSTAWDWHFNLFTEGKVAMTMDPSWRTWQLDAAKMSDDWGFVLGPKGPRAKDYRVPNDENVLVIPSTYKSAEVDAILTAINLWSIPVAANWKDVMYRACRDARAVDETHTLLRTPGYTSFRMHTLIPNLNTGDIAWTMWWYDGDPAQLVESVSQNWNSLINETNVTKRK